MIGNDIVDLRDPAAQPETFRKRFDERVFAAEERREMDRDATPLARRWAHWAAKEAAYKLARQIDSAFVFSPARLVAHFEDAEPAEMAMDSGFERRGRLELPRGWGGGIRSLELRSFETSERVHVVAVPLGSDWGGVDLAVEAIDPGADDASVAVRELAIRGISRSLGILSERLAIGRDGRIPIVELDGSRTSLSLSLSHHGRWIGYATRLRIEMQSQSEWTNRWIGSAGRMTGRTWSP